MGELGHWCQEHAPKFEQYPQPFHYVPVKHVLAYCPEFYSWCLGQRIMPSICAVLRWGHQPQGSPHRDWTDRNLALNFGLKIPQGSYTAQYATADPGFNEQVPSHGWRHSIPLESCQEIDRFTLDQPTLFNVQIPHAVINPTWEERLSISFRFHQDPWHLAKQ